MAANMGTGFNQHYSQATAFCSLALRINLGLGSRNGQAIATSIRSGLGLTKNGLLSQCSSLRPAPPNKPRHLLTSNPVPPKTPEKKSPERPKTGINQPAQTSRSSPILPSLHPDDVSGRNNVCAKAAVRALDLTSIHSVGSFSGTGH